MIMVECDRTLELPRTIHRAEYYLVVQFYFKTEFARATADLSEIRKVIKKVCSTEYGAIAHRHPNTQDTRGNASEAP